MIKDGLRTYFYSLMTDTRKGTAAGVLKSILSVLSFIYYCVIEFVLFLYSVGALKSYRPACKVISVGNITLGGTGKTPLVAAIAGKFKASGKKVVILSRGYKGQRGKAVSDEVELFKRRFPEIPVLVGRDRIKTARQAEALKADIILLDDGFQHWPLKRDIDIVAVAINNPFGNGKIIPRGILREPLSSLKRAGIFVLTKVAVDGDSIAKAQGLKNRLETINKKAKVFTSSYIPYKLFDFAASKEVPLSEIEGKKVALLCGIADPSSFEDTVSGLRAEAVLKFFFMDHHKYSGDDLEAVINECKKRGIDTVLTTDKDVPRLIDSPRAISGSPGIKFLAVGIDIKIDKEESFFGRLYSVPNS